MGSTTKQAQGAAGSLFRLAKTRMAPENFSKVASAVPDMDQLLAAAPALDAKGPAPERSARQWARRASGTWPVSHNRSGSSGLKGDAVKKAVPVLTNYVGKTSGGDLGKLLGESLR